MTRLVEKMNRPGIDGLSMLVCLLAVMLLGLSACSKDPGGGGDGGDAGGGPKTSKGAIEVRVESSAGQPLSGASVQVRDRTVQTGADGSVVVDGLEAGRAVVRATADGHVPATAVSSVSADATTPARVTLAAEGKIGRFEVAAGGRFSHGRAEVTVPPDAVVDSEGNPVSGEVDVSVTGVDTLGSAAGAAVLPGPTDAVRVAEGSETTGTTGDGPAMIQPLGLAHIALRKDGNPLQIAEGKSIQVVLTLPESASDQYAPGDEIDAYWYDEREGEWVRDGVGTVKSVDGQLSWVAKLEHLTWWGSCKTVEDLDCISIHVVDADGADVPGAAIAANGLTGAARSEGVTDGSGRACAETIRGSRVRIVVVPPTGYAKSRVTREVQAEDAGAQCGGSSCSQVEISVGGKTTPDPDAGMPDTGQPDTGSPDGGNGGGNLAVDFVAVGSQHGCGATSGGKVKCWGKNFGGQLGNGTMNSASMPVSVKDLSTAKGVWAGTASCARTEDGTLYCWGPNDKGVLGDGTTQSRSAPVEILSDVVAFDTDAHACAVKESGKVFCWGENDRGQLGDGTTKERHSPTEVKGITDAVDVAVGSNYTVAVLASGKVRWWGHAQGRVNGENHIPVDLQGVSNATRASAGYNHSCVVLKDGSVGCWGVNNDGELGNGTTGEPTNPQTTPSKVKGVTNAVDVVAGLSHSCALLADGSIKCWGENRRGQLGNGESGISVGPETTPVQVKGISQAVAIDGGTQTCAMLQDRSVHCWGLVTMPDGTRQEKPSPVKVAF